MNIVNYKLSIIYIALSALIGCGGNDEMVSDTDAGSNKTQDSATPLHADAGKEQYLNFPDNVISLNGVSNGVMTKWSVLGGEESVIIGSPNTNNTRVIIKKPGDYKFRLTATGPTGDIKNSDTTVTVLPNPTVLNESSTPLDHLKALNKPNFKSGHTLLPLSQWSCYVDESIRLELLKNWGYSAQFGRGTSLEGSLAKEVKNNPGKYPIEFSINSLYGIFDNYNFHNTLLPKLPPEVWLRDASGNIILNGGRPIVSPAAPDRAFYEVGQFVGEEASKIEKELNQPIRIINNGGEYGLWLLTENNPSSFYGRDPSVQKDFENSGLQSWYDYNAKNKARQEKLIKEGIYSKINKGKPIYSWYQESYGTSRGRWWGWEGYNFRWENFIGKDGIPLVSDYSSPETYYSFHNTGWTGYHHGAMVPMDALTEALKNIGGTIKLGQKYIYPWVSMGWDGGDSGGISENDLFVGMMKTYYTAGAIGAVSGYFTCEGEHFFNMKDNRSVGLTVPTQIRGFHLLSQVHALFSHLQYFVDNSTLLSGPNMHPYVALGESTPAMEFPVKGETVLREGISGNISVPTARVVARKFNGKDQWLITTWANTGSDRNIQVTIDQKLGELTLNARRAGSVYIAEVNNGLVNVKLIDTDAMNPTRNMFP